MACCLFLRERQLSHVIFTRGHYIRACTHMHARASVECSGSRAPDYRGQTPRKLTSSCLMERGL